MLNNTKDVNMKSIQRVALVTGSTSGIGQAIAVHLAKQGFAVAFHSRTSVEAGQKLAKMYEHCSYTRADLSDQEQCKTLINSVLAQHGRLDVLVNNAGINAMIPHGNLKQANAQIWRDLYEVNVIAPWTLITEAQEALTQASSEKCPGSIINVSSHAGIRPKGASIPYAVSKAALNHMTKLLALNLGPDIRVNAIAPGLVNTPMTQNWDFAQQLWQQKSPMKRGAEPADIAHIASMLIENQYITGEVLLVDGGLNLT